MEAMTGTKPWVERSFTTVVSTDWTSPTCPRSSGPSSLRATNTLPSFPLLPTASPPAAALRPEPAWGFPSLPSCQVARIYPYIRVGQIRKPSRKRPAAEVQIQLHLHLRSPHGRGSPRQIGRRGDAVADDGHTADPHVDPLRMDAGARPSDRGHHTTPVRFASTQRGLHQRRCHHRVGRRRA